jgi:hypothetical protein
MRPHLHPDMGMVPISARVALRLTALRYKQSGLSLLQPGIFARQVLLSLPIGLDGMLRLALHSLGVYLDLGMSSQEWLQNVLEASHYGSSFRRCFFFAYKEQRRPYPRVTNRGVQDLSQASSGRVRKGKVNG